MKQKLLFTLLLIFTIKSFSQDSKFSLELNYPIPIDKNFIGKNYSGIIDFGADYRFAKLNPINIGFSINGGVLINNSNQNNGFQNFKVTSYVINPRIFGELDFKPIEKIHPIIGLGYTIIIFKASGTNNGFDVSDGSDTLSGVNVNLGLAYDIIEKLFVKIQYDFIKLGADNNVTDTTFNTNVNILKIGFGYRL